MANISIHTYIYLEVYFYPRTLSALPHDACPHWSPVRDLGSPRDLWCRDTKLRVLIGGVLLGRGGAVLALLATGRSPRPSGDVCAEPLRHEGSPETRGVPSSGAGPSQNGTCSGGGIGRKIRAGRSAVNYFGFGRT